MTDMLNTYNVEMFFCHDDRLPENGSDGMVRQPPTAEFLDDVAIHGILQPICWGYNTKEKWQGIIFGRKRLMAVRKLYDDGRHSGNIPVRVIDEVDPWDVPVISMVENAHRTKNELGAYKDIQDILLRDNTQTFDTIARMIGMPTKYVKDIDRKYCRIPKWALKAALDDKITTAVALEVGRLGEKQKMEALASFQAKEKLPMSAVDDLKRAKKAFQATIMSSMFPAMPIAQPKREYIPRHEIERLLNIAEGQYDIDAIITELRTLLTQ